MSRRLLLASVVLVAPALAPAAEAPILVCAASSLAAPLQEIAARFAAQPPYARAAVHVAGSTALRRQIEIGGPCDVFVAAGIEDAAALRAQGRLAAGAVLGGNRLVVVTRRDAAPLRALAELLAPQWRRIAVADPTVAPLGVYSMQALTATGMATALAAKLVPCTDAAHVTAAVASGNADAGLTYRTGARSEARLLESFAIPESLHAPIVYVIAPLRHAADPAAAARFVDFACGPMGAAVLQQHGFTPRAGVATSTAASVALATDRSAASVGATSRFAPVILSARVALVATVFSSCLGLTLAAYLAQAHARRGRDVVAALVDLPMVLPPTVVGVVLLELLAPQRPLGALLQHAGMQVAFTWGAAVIAAAVMALPLMVRPARSALEAVPRRYVQAARSLGAGPWRVFWRVQLPLARRGIVAGVVLAFFRALGEFGATLMVAGNIPGRTQTLPLAIYSAVFTGRTGEALAWVVGVAALSFAGALLAQRLAGSRTP